MSRPFGQKTGDALAQRAAKEATRAVFRLVRLRSGLTPAQLEEFFGFELDEGNLHTGQAWLRYECRYDIKQRRECNRAASDDRLDWIVRKSLLNHFLSEDEAARIGVGESSISLTEYKMILANHTAAKDLFEKGKRRMLKGQMPLSPSPKGGTPRPARNADEAREKFREWTGKIESVGMRVYEDRTELGEREQIVAEAVRDEGRMACKQDYIDRLDEWEWPFNPVTLNPFAVDRLKLVLVGTKPRAAQPIEIPVCWLPAQPWARIQATTATHSDLCEFFENIEKVLRASVEQQSGDVRVDFTQQPT